MEGWDLTLRGMVLQPHPTDPTKRYLHIPMEGDRDSDPIVLTLLLRWDGVRLVRAEGAADVVDEQELERGDDDGEDEEAVLAQEAHLEEAGGVPVFDFRRDFDFIGLGVMLPTHAVTSTSQTARRIRFQAGMKAGAPFINSRGHVHHRVAFHAKRIVDSLFKEIRNPRPRNNPAAATPRTPARRRGQIPDFNNETPANDVS
jgi:hypothetical protein